MINVQYTTNGFYKLLKYWAIRYWSAIYRVFFQIRTSKASKSRVEETKEIINLNRLRMFVVLRLVVILLSTSHIFLVLYPANVNGGMVQTDGLNQIQSLAVEFFKKSNDFEDKQQTTM